MLTVATGDLKEQLRGRGYSQTTWDELGLSYDDAIANRVIAACPEKLIHSPDQDILREAKAVSPACLSAARALADPLVKRLFEDDEDAQSRWWVFGVNYYVRGNMFPPHRDLNNPALMTIAIVSLSGARRFRVEGAPRPIDLEPQSIMLLDGGINPQHSAECLAGPSVSVVADIPASLAW